MNNVQVVFLLRFLYGVMKIQVYVSVLTKERDKWYGNETQVGYAVVGYLPNSNEISIDIDTRAR